MLTINSVTVKSPSKMVISFFNVGSRVETNAAGNAVMDRVARKRRLELEWSYLTHAEQSLITTNTAGVFFSVQYFDPQAGTRTGTFYVTNHTLGLQRYTGTSAVGWEDVKLELTEQ